MSNDNREAPDAEAAAPFISVNDLRQWQYDIRVDSKVRQMAGDAANEIERLNRTSLRSVPVPAFPRVLTTAEQLLCEQALINSSEPVPAPGVTVTDEMVERTRLKILPFISHLTRSVQTEVVRDALSAALRPKESS